MSELPIDTIICGDCLEVMKDWPDGCVDAVVTDPPYGIDYQPKGSGSKRRKQQNRKPCIVNDNHPFDPSPLLRLSKTLVLWGAHHYASRLTDSGGWLVWDKKRGATLSRGFTASDCELAWTNVGGSVKMFNYMWNGLCRDGEVGEHYHPTQKAIALMEWCLKVTGVPADGIVLDPYCGSGTTAVACIRTGRHYIGIEIDPGYCEIARRRVAAETPSLFAQIGETK